MARSIIAVIVSYIIMFCSLFLGSSRCMPSSVRRRHSSRVRISLRIDGL